LISQGIVSHCWFSQSGLPLLNEEEFQESMYKLIEKFFVLTSAAASSASIQPSIQLLNSSVSVGYGQTSGEQYNLNASKPSTHVASISPSSRRFAMIINLILSPRLGVSSGNSKTKPRHQVPFITAIAIIPSRPSRPLIRLCHQIPLPF